MGISIRIVSPLYRGGPFDSGCFCFRCYYTAVSSQKQAKIPRLSRLAFIPQAAGQRTGIPRIKADAGAQTVGMFRRFVTMALTAVCLAAGADARNVFHERSARAARGEFYDCDLHRQFRHAGKAAHSAAGTEKLLKTPDGRHELCSAADGAADQFLRRIVTHALQAEVAGRDLDDDGELRPGFTGMTCFITLMPRMFSYSVPSPRGDRTLCRLPSFPVP